MWKQKGQGIVEYALILAFVVGIGGVLFANGNLADSIRSVFSNVNIQLSAATTPQEIIERLRQGRYEGLAAELKKPSKTLEITSDSAEGEKLAKELNIQAKPGDAWFVRIFNTGHTVLTYYSADANGGKTYDTLKKDYATNPSIYYMPAKGKPVTVKIDEGNYDGRGEKVLPSGPYYHNATGYVGPSPSGTGISINPTPANNL